MHPPTGILAVSLILAVSISSFTISSVLLVVRYFSATYHNTSRNICDICSLQTHTCA